MKCPKCGFNSFEFLDTCKKCGNSLTPFKQNLGIRAVLLPSRQDDATPLPDGGAGSAQTREPAEEGADDFSWESPAEAAPAEPHGNGFAGAGPEEGSSGGIFEAFSFAEPDDREEPPAAGRGKDADEDRIADLPESSGTAGSWRGGDGPADFGALEPDVFPFEAQGDSPKKGTASDGEADGPAPDTFDSLFGAAEPDKQ